MIKISAFVLALPFVLSGATEAMARHHHRHVRIEAPDRSSGGTGTNAYGDVIISGKAGFHRYGLDMVRDVRGTDDPDDAGLIGANGSVGLRSNGQ